MVSADGHAGAEIHDYRGYLEDRRPNSLADPYRVAGRILQTIETIPADATELSVQMPEAAAA